MKYSFIKHFIFSFVLLSVLGAVYIVFLFAIKDELFLEYYNSIGFVKYLLEFLSVIAIVSLLLATVKNFIEKK